MSTLPKEGKNTIPQPGIVFLRPFLTDNSSTDSKQPKGLVLLINKKIFKSAVLRNLVKRKIKEAYRLSVKKLKHDTLHQLPLLRIEAREGILKMKPNEIQKLIQIQLLNKLSDKK